jgi:ferredoxin--NADP+ reductase
MAILVVRHVAVVGAGLSGIYMADELVRGHGFTVDIIERLPAPYGLVRYGVAPDHMKMKSVIRALEKVFLLPGVRFFGNVEVGRDISAEQLRARYDAVVYAVGAPDSRRLGVPGEDLGGVIPAPDMVAWYTAHPDAIAPPALNAVTSMVVIGAGNVALDTSRLLARSADELQATDIPDQIISRLTDSGARDIHIVARRGPGEAKFTHKELAEIGELPHAGVAVHYPAARLAELAASLEGVPQADVATFLEWAERTPVERARTIHFHVGLAAARLEGDAWVERAVFADSDTGAEQVIDAQIVVTAIGSAAGRSPGCPSTRPGASFPATRAGLLRAARRWAGSTWWAGPGAARPGSSAPTSATLPGLPRWWWPTWRACPSATASLWARTRCPAR